MKVMLKHGANVEYSCELGKSKYHSALPAPAVFPIGILEKKIYIQHVYKSQFRIENYLDEQWPAIWSICAGLQFLPS